MSIYGKAPKEISIGVMSIYGVHVRAFGSQGQRRLAERVGAHTLSRYGEIPRKTPFVSMSIYEQQWPCSSLQSASGGRDRWGQRGMSRYGQSPEGFGGRRKPGPTDACMSAARLIG